MRRRVPVLLAAALTLPVPLAAPAHAVDQQCSLLAAQFSRQAPAAVAQLGIRSAWQVTRGAGVTVAVVDTGVDAGNPHLRKAVRPGLDLVEGTDGRVDPDGRGTAVAGQIAAREIPESGVVGLAPQATILPVRVLATHTPQGPDDPSGPDAERTAAGIRWAADNGATVIVVGQDFESTTPALTGAVDHATAAGALVVATAGDRSDQQSDADPVRYPAGLSSALAVTSLDARGQASTAANHGVHVELAAPGQSVLTTLRGLGDCEMSIDQASSVYATGYAGAAAALVAAAHPRERPADWEYRLLATGLRPSGPERDPDTGWGVIAPYDAINFVDDGGVAGPPNPRFAAPTTAVPPAMVRPDPPADHTPARRSGVGWTVGGTVAGAAGVALSVALARTRRARRPGRHSARPTP